MTYDDALARLASLGPELRTGKAGAPRKWSLDHIRALLRALGDPQTRFRSVLIAGTNGKGSTAATLASILNVAGVRTGLYTSPHLLHVNERIRLSAGSPPHLSEITDADFARLFTLVDETAQTLVHDELLPHPPSFFELLTALAFCFFAEVGIDLAVLEVGLGGRLDATNVVDPLVSVITDIGIDHTEFLGHTISAIAAEKAGILRPGGVLVTLSQHPEANAAIGEAAVALNVRGVDASRCLPPRDMAVRPTLDQSIDINTSNSKLAPNRYRLSIEGNIIHIDSPLAGQHQQRNIALAVATALELRANHSIAIPDTAIEQGVRVTEWPGRLEWIASPSGHAPLLLDVAHNPAGAWALRAALAQLPDELPRTLIFSCLSDKQIGEMAQILFPLFDSTSGDPARAHDHILLAPIQNPRAANVDDLLAAAQALGVPAHAAPHVPGALAQAQAITPPHGIIVVTGSVFLIGELRSLALTQTAAASTPHAVLHGDQR
ncbi:MAG TPA: folylpolyglutamate synthase/dihydrofolate synthase family protein [Acidobacteriaceae bacterium]|jgi:dihydrofolate synthase/folylpolyglutamate synthase|nr:folylpolyglutamate synthase/dihydrofolate synthase family protein [Acidobacteriaceae bacterium]